jgi:hypothetical protein
MNRLLSNVAFKFNLRRYNKEYAAVANSKILDFKPSSFGLGGPENTLARNEVGCLCCGGVVYVSPVNTYFDSFTVFCVDGSKLVGLLASENVRLNGFGGFQYTSLANYLGHCPPQV